MSRTIELTRTSIAAFLLSGSLLGLSGCSEEQKEKWGEAGREAKEAAAAAGEAIRESAKEAKARIQEAAENAQPTDPDTMARRE